MNTQVTHLDSESFSAPSPETNPRVVVDSAGNAVMAWIRPNFDLYTAYRAAGDATLFGAPQLVGTLSGSGIGRYALAMDSLGNAVIVWKDACAASACTLKSKMRPRGSATAFGSELTITTTARAVIQREITGGAPDARSFARWGAI